jgi:WD40 repeat protein
MYIHVCVYIYENIYTHIHINTYIMYTYIFVGIWPPESDQSDINTTDRHVGEKFLATGDDLGQVKVFNAPCVKVGSKYLACDGHSSHVTCVRWTIGDHLISTGGNDNCTFVWTMTTK